MDAPCAIKGGGLRLFGGSTFGAEEDVVEQEEVALSLSLPLSLSLSLSFSSVPLRPNPRRNPRLVFDARALPTKGPLLHVFALELEALFPAQTGCTHCTSRARSN